MKIGEYRKLIAVVVGLAVMLLHRHSGIDLSGQEAALVDIVIAVGTAVAVERAPNDRPRTEE